LIVQENRHTEQRVTRSAVRRRGTCYLLAAVLLLTSLCMCTGLFAQQSVPNKTFHDTAYKLSFDYPANWTFTTADSEVSTFHLDIRSAGPTTTMRAVTAMPENPFPASTFSGAYVYFSTTPKSSEAACALQATPPTDGTVLVRPQPVQITGVTFNRGHEELRDVCIIQRDEIYTTYRRGVCYRFDLAINNFCGEQVSGVKDITSQELGQVRSRLESIFNTIRFDAK
jgi:hypothetical protein